MPESLNAFDELVAIRERVEGIEHRQEMLVRAHADEILEAIWKVFDRDPTLAQVYLEVDGKSLQADIVAKLKKRGITTTQQNVSLKLKRLTEELGLVDLGGRAGGRAASRKSEVDRILHLSPKVERRLAALAKAKQQKGAATKATRR